MDFISNILYQVGTSFEENNIDLELRKKLDAGKLYSSYRYSEIYLFGKVFESVCYLWYMDNKLTTIEYRFHNRFLEHFIESINDELPQNNKLNKDPFIEKHEYYAFQESVAIHLVDLNTNFFLLRISNTSTLLNIKNSNNKQT